MKPSSSDLQEPPLDANTTAGARVADGMAETIMNGPEAMAAKARSYSDHEIRLGLLFLAEVMEIASMSARHLAEEQRERGSHASPTPGWN